jgi:hypothetical protein
VDFNRILEFRRINRRRLVKHICKNDLKKRPLKPELKNPKMRISLMKSSINSYVQTFQYNARDEIVPSMLAFKNMQKEGVVINPRMFLRKLNK